MAVNAKIKNKIIIIKNTNLLLEKKFVMLLKISLFLLVEEEVFTRTNFPFF